MTIQLARQPYNRRPVSDPFASGFFQDEHTLIQQAIPVSTAKKVTAAYTAQVMDDLIEVDASGGAVTVTLPDPTRVAYLVLTIKKVDSSANAVTIGATVDGVASPTLPNQYNAVTVMSDGAAWVELSAITTPVSSGITGTTARLTSDTTTAGGAYVTAGLPVSVNSGDSWSIRWVLWLGTSAAASGGIGLQITQPGASAQRGLAFGVKAGGTFASVVSSASTLALDTSFANADFSGGDAWCVVDASFDTFSSSGSVDLQFKNDGAGETAKIKRTSAVLAYRTH